MEKVMLITGANKGIGYYMVKLWLEKGNIAIVLDVCCNEINKLKIQYSKKLITYVCDVSDDRAVKKCVEEVVNRVNSIDIAVHNACICIFKDLGQHKLEEYMRIYKVNFIGAVNITKAILPHMKENDNGRICYTSSGVGVTGYINISGYSSSKGAIESFARCMEMENIHNNITFHILQPPLTNTESSSPLPVPKEFKANAQKVGYGFIKRIYNRGFVIAPSFSDGLLVRMSYCFPRFTGRLLVKMTNKVRK